jgi:hypothetical protein
MMCQVNRAMDPLTVTKVQKWVALDNKMEIKKAKMKEYTDEKKVLEEDIISYVQENNKTNVQINTSDGHIDFHEVRTPQALSVKYIKDTLMRFFDERNEDPDKARRAIDAEWLTEYLMEHREARLKTTMRRHISSKKRRGQD